MDDSKARPRAGDPPKLDSTIDILRELLDTERRRLQVALRIEDQRNIVFPETTVIIRDIERLTIEIEKRESQGGDNTFDMMLQNMPDIDISSIYTT
jgi:hypothetical protein